MSAKQLNEKEIFNFARRLDSEAVSQYLDQVCGDDQPLRSRVEELLRLHEQDTDFLQKPAAQVMPTADMTPVTEKPGSEIGPYKLREQLGEGGFGVVYVAEQTKPVRRKVALKIIKPGMDTKIQLPHILLFCAPITRLRDWP